MTGAVDTWGLLDLDSLDASRPEKLVHAGHNVRLLHLRKLRVGRAYRQQQRPFAPHASVTVGNLARHGPVGQLLAHHFAPMQQQISFQTALATQTVFEDFRD